MNLWRKSAVPRASFQSLFPTEGMRYPKGMGSSP
jgi:hypothetical protein